MRVPIFDDEAFARSLLMQDRGADISGMRIEPLVGGLSEASVFVVKEDGHPTRYLKIAHRHAADALRDEIARTRWLAQCGMRVPEILRVDDRAGAIAVLTAAVPGIAAEASPLPAPRLVDALARGLAALHALAPVDCPFDESVATRLARAAAAVAAGDVDPQAFAPRNLGVAPAALLARLSREPPAEDVVVIHGDATLSNLIVDEDGTLGFVDCGNAGRGDRYVDLAVLSAELEEAHGPEAAARFAAAYGAAGWAGAKARYFSDLYELF
jgi:aminoglycoside phosphotransferase